MIIAATLVVHVLITTKLYFVPESLAIVILGKFLSLLVPCLVFWVHPSPYLFY